MKRLLMLIVAACVIMVTACGGEAEQQNPTQPASLSVLSKDQLVLERKVAEGDFELAIYTKKIQYEENEPIEVYAELTYIGELNEIEIGHSMYPVGFNILEHTRDYEIRGSMNEPYIVTQLTRNEPVRYPYSFSGGYSEEDNKDYITFVESIKDDKLPQGEYTIGVGASFKLHGNDSASPYGMSTSISFVVGSPQINSPIAKVVLELQEKVIEGDYELAIYSRKSEYTVNETVTLFAELTYIGEQEEIEITHTMYPVSFGTVENTSNGHYGRIIDQPLGTTLLKRNDPMVYVYQFNGVLLPISDHSADESFNEELSNNMFPEGNYTITAYADFNVKDEVASRRFDTSIIIDVIPEEVQQ